MEAIQFGLTESEALTIEQAFLPKVNEAGILINIYEGIIAKELTPELVVEAKELRLKLVKVRTGLTEVHKSQKNYFLCAGRFVDAWKNKLTLPVEQMEEKLQAIEQHFFNIEKQRLAELEQSRLALITPYMESTFGMDFKTMPQDVFDAYLESKKQAHQAAILAAEEQRAQELKIAQEKANLQKIAAEKAAALEKENKKLAAANLVAKKAAAKLEEENQQLKAQSMARMEMEAMSTPTSVKDWIDSFELPTPPNIAKDEKIFLIINKFESFKLWAQKQI